MSMYRKKKKINLQFIAVIASVVVLGGGLIGGFAYFQITRAPARNIALGDSLMAEGKFQSAKERYGRAVRKRPNNADYLAKMQSAITKIVPDSLTRAEQFFQEYLGIVAQKARVSKGGQDLAVWREYIELLEQTIQFVDMTQQMKEASETMASRFPTTDAPAQFEARRTAAMAAAVRSLSGRSTDEEAERTRRDLIEVFRAEPQNPRSVRWLSRMTMFMVDSVRMAGNPSKTLAARQEAEALFAEMTLLQPNNPTIPAWQSMMLRDQQVADTLASFPPLDEARSRLLASAQTAIVAEEDLAVVRAALTVIPANAGRDVAIALMQRSTGPDAQTRVALELARVQVATDPEASETALEAIIAAQSPPVGIAALRVYSEKIEAAQLLTTARIAAYENVKGTPEAVQRLIDVETSIKSLEAIDKDSQRILDAAVLARVQLASVKGEVGTVIQLGLPIINRPGDPDPELATLISNAYLSRNEPGEALRILDRALRKNPDSGLILVTRARALAVAGRFDEVVEEANRLERLMPGNQQIAELKEHAISRLAGGVTPLAEPTDIVVQALNRAIAKEVDGDLEGALALVRVVCEETPEDRRPVLALARLLVIHNRREEAADAVQAFSDEHPQDKEMKVAALGLRESDPVKRIDAILTMDDVDAEVRPVRRVLLLESENRGALERARTEPDTVKREVFINDAKALLEEYFVALQDLRDSGIKTPSALEVMMFAAADKNDEAEMARVLDLARTTGDPWLAGLLKAGTLRQGGKHTEAVKEFEAIVQDPAAPLAAWNALARSYVEVGRAQDALRVMNESYNRRPTDPVVAREFASLLVRFGQTNQALDVLRKASAANVRDAALTNEWMVAEGLYGNRTTAVLMRRQRLRSAPGDLDNVRQLVRLLCVAAPSAELAVDSRGQPRLTTSSWSALSMAQRNGELLRIRTELMGEAEMLAGKLFDRDRTDISSALALASGLEASGEGARAATVLETYAAKAPPAVGARLLMAAAEANASLGKVVDMNRLIELAKGLRAPEDFEFERIAAAIYNIRGKFDEAIASLDDGIAIVEARLAAHPEESRLHDLLRGYDIDKLTVLARLRDTVRMKKTIEHMKSHTLETSTNADKALVIAAEIQLLEIENNNAFARGENELLSQILKDIDQRIDAALRIQPGDARPLITRSSMGRQQARRTGDRAQLDEALAAVMVAEEMVPGSWNVTAERVRVHIARGEDEEAVKAIERYLVLDPQSAVARDRLAGVYRATGDQAAALKVWDDAIAADAIRVDYRRSKGEILGMMGRYGEAGLAFEQAFQLGGRLEDLVRSVQGRLAVVPFDGKPVLALLYGRDTEVAQVLLLKSALAAARFQTGLRDDALRALRDIWRQNAAAGSERQDDGPWYAAVGTVFQPERLADMEVFLLDTMGTPKGMACTQIAMLVVRDPAASESALKWLSKALGDQTLTTEERAAVLDLKGQVFTTQGKYNEAIEAFVQSSAADPLRATALNNMAYLEAKHLGRYEDAIRHARASIDLIGTPNADILDTLGYALMKAGQLDEAAVRLDDAAEIRPSALILLHQGMLQQLRNRIPEAEQFGNRAAAVAVDVNDKAEIQAFLESLKK